MQGHKAIVISTVLDDHCKVRIALFRNTAESSRGLTSADFTLAQAKCLRMILDAAIAAASIAPADVAPYVNDTVRETASNDDDVRQAER